MNANKNLTELKEIAKTICLKNYSKLKKAELIKAIDEHCNKCNLNLTGLNLKDKDIIQIKIEEKKINKAEEKETENNTVKNEVNNDDDKLTNTFENIISMSKSIQDISTEILVKKIIADFNWKLDQHYKITDYPLRTGIDMKHITQILGAFSLDITSYSSCFRRDLKYNDDFIDKITKLYVDKITTIKPFNITDYKVMDQYILSEYKNIKRVIE